MTEMSMEHFLPTHTVKTLQWKKSLELCSSNLHSMHFDWSRKYFLCYLIWIDSCYTFPSSFYKIFKRFSGWHETLLRELPLISSFLISWAAFSSIQNYCRSFKAPSQDSYHMRSIDREVSLWRPNVVFEFIRNCKWCKMTQKIYS